MFISCTIKHIAMKIAIISTYPPQKCCIATLDKIFTPPCKWPITKTYTLSRYPMVAKKIIRSKSASSSTSTISRVTLRQQITSIISTMFVCFSTSMVSSEGRAVRIFWLCVADYISRSLATCTPFHRNHRIQSVAFCFSSVNGVIR